MAETAIAPRDHASDIAAAAVSPARLAPWLEAVLPGCSGPLTIEPAAGGMSNPTYFVTAGAATDHERRMVLRTKPVAQLSAAAHRIDREYRLLTALAGSAVPVPEAIAYGEDEAVIGRPFYLMSRLEGVVSHDYTLPGLSPAARPAAFAGMARTLAAIHLFDWAGAGLSDFGKPGNYFARQIDGWSRQWATFGIADNPAVDRLERWLRAELPADDGCAAIAHGDYRAANIMFLPDGTVSGVFDWELATIGHPLADLGFCLQGWFLAPDENGGIAGLDLAALGIPTAREFVETYYRAAPGLPQLRAFHVAFAMYRAAVGVSGVAMRAEAGIRPGPTAGAQARRFAKAYARAGLHAIDSWDR
ncbi:MAG: phosphotransferase family protein [Pseudomonadota bacterium]